MPPTFLIPNGFWWNENGWNPLVKARRSVSFVQTFGSKAIAFSSVIGGWSDAAATQFWKRVPKSRQWIPDFVLDPSTSLLGPFFQLQPQLQLQLSTSEFSTSKLIFQLRSWKNNEVEIVQLRLFKCWFSHEYLNLEKYAEVERSTSAFFQLQLHFNFEVDWLVKLKLKHFNF